jgi:CRP-like cAMP-binding protein
MSEPIAYPSMISRRQSRRARRRWSLPTIRGSDTCSEFRSSAVQRGRASSDRRALADQRSSGGRRRHADRRVRDAFFVLIDGTAAVRTPVGAGAELHPGDFFGEMSLLDGEPRSASIVATTPLRLLIVDRAHFWRLLDETPELIRRMLTILSRRVRRLEQTVEAILRGTNPT